jgi:hypothetical protein
VSALQDWGSGSSDISFSVVLLKLMGNIISTIEKGPILCIGCKRSIELGYV